MQQLRITDSAFSYKTIEKETVVATTCKSARVAIHDFSKISEYKKKIKKLNFLLIIPVKIYAAKFLYAILFRLLLRILWFK